MNVDTWMQYRDAVEMIVPILALVISFLSIVLTVFSAWAQQRHFRMTMTPIPFIRLSDYENLIAVELVNGGYGTFVIDTVLVTPDAAKARRARKVGKVASLPRQLHVPRFRGRLAGAGEFDSLIDCVEDEIRVRRWDEFLQMYEERPVRASEVLTLLQLSKSDGDDGFELERRAVRRRLAPYFVVVTGRDANGRRVRAAVRSLDWFGRDLEEGQALSRRGPGGM
jgi:hypothetical protein